MTRTIAIGLDGCSWNVLDPLLDTGELPNLAALRESGASGVLESTIPFYTGPAWASFATAASPAGHGIFDFMMLRDDGELSVATQNDLRRGTYYEQLGSEERRSVLINLPIDQQGCAGAVIVNSWLTDDEARRILPVGRRERYRRLLESYRTFPVNPSNVHELCALEEARFDLARELFLSEQWDHFFVLFSSTDWLGHAGTGRFLSGDDGAREAFLTLYRQLDDYIGWFAEHAPDATLAVLSDHGQCEEKVVVRVNAVLQRLGLAELRPKGGSGQSPFFVDRRPGPRARIQVPSALSRHRSNPLVRPLALAAKRAARRGLGVNVTAASHVVDRRASKAFSPTDASFAIYAPECDQDELQRIRDGLLGLEYDGGTPAIEGVWTPEELYGRPGGADGPSLLFAPTVGARPSATVKDRVIDYPAAPGRGCHQRDGIVVFAGPHVASAELSPTSICDVAPTLLWAMEAGVPSGGDGRVLFEAFEPAFASTNALREVEALAGSRSPIVAEEESGEVTRRLKALGYI
jgi:predicted AlkP superfamily phosphohydrolase/phosphomutase